MRTVQMRKEITATFSSVAWAEKVKKMSDSQVQAVYFRLKQQGRIK